MRRIRPLALALVPVLGLALVSTSGCTHGRGPDSQQSSSTGIDLGVPPKGEPSAEQTATQLAEALARGDVSKLAIVGDQGASAAATKDYTTIMAGMDGLRPKVRATKLEYGKDGVATLTLEHTFTMGAKPWTFTSVAALNLVGDQWKVAWRPSIVHPQLSQYSRMRHSRELPARATITDAAGHPLMHEMQVVEIGLDKQNLERAKWDSSADQLAKALKIDVAAFKKKVVAYGEKAFVPAITMRPDDVPEAAEQVPGVSTQKHTTTGNVIPRLAESILGTVGQADEATAKASKGTIEPGDTVGTTGLQKRYDAQLRGTSGESVELVKRNGVGQVPAEQAANIDVVAYVQEPVEGKSLQLTLDAGLQQRAEKVLAGVKPVASLVAIRPSTGEVVAAANSPARHATPDATFGRFAPGSTFKIVTALALVRTGLSAQSKVDCPATVTVNGRTFKNYDDYPSSMTGRITLAQALAHSCNTAFIQQAQSLDKGALADAAASLGFGVDHDAGLPVFYGSAPISDDPVVRSADAIGQGQIEASALAMGGVIASVAGGRTVLPWIIKGHQPTQKGRPLSSNEAQQLRQMTRATVTEGPVSKYRATMTGAKTGTAEYGNAKPPKTHAWLVAYSGDLAVAVMVEDGASGTTTAAPLVDAFLKG